MVDNNIFFGIFIVYAIFVHLLSANVHMYYFIYLCACTCFSIGIYLIYCSKTSTNIIDNLNSLYICLSIIYSIALSIFLLKYSYHTTVPSIFVLSICLIILILFMKYILCIRILIPDLNAGVNLITSMFSNLNASDHTLSYRHIIFIICILVTFIILSMVYNFQYIFTSMLFLILFLCVISYINKTSISVSKIFFTYNTLYLFIFLGILLFLYSIRFYNLPNVNNLLIYGVICSIIFGLKHFIFNNVVPPHLFLYFIFAIIIGVIYISFSSSFIPYSNKNIILYSLFAILCILFSLLLGNISSSIPFILFIISLIITSIFCIYKYSINIYTLIYIAIFGLLYCVIHSLNKLDFINASDNCLIPIYLIICCIIFYLYFFISHNLKQIEFHHKSQMIPFISLLITFIGVSTIALTLVKLNKVVSILLFWIFIAGLLCIYYGFNNAIYKDTNFIITVCLIYYFIGLLQFIYINQDLWKISILAMVALLTLIIWFITHFRSKFSNADEYGPQTSIYYVTIILLLIILILSMYKVYTDFTKITLNLKMTTNLFYWITLIFLGSMFIYYIYFVFTKNTVHKKIYSIIFAFILFYIIFKLFKQKSKSNTFTILISDIIEYLPCLYDQIISTLMQLPTNATNSPVNVISLYIIVFMVICILLYKYGYSYLKKMLYTSGHTLIDNTPIQLNKKFVVISYDNLQELKFNPYQFGISFKLYLYPIPANNTDFTLLTFSNYMYIQYNSYLNHLTIWRSPDNLKEPVLIYRHSKVPLQTWISYEINFINNTCDVFVNNTFKSTTQHIPLYNNNNNTDVVIGNNNDDGSLIQGTIKDLIIYNYTLNMFQISMIK